MYIFELLIPGTWLDYEDSDWCWKMGNMLDQLESQYFEANSTLNLFMASSETRSPSRDRWEDSRRRREIQQQVEEEMGRGYANDRLEEAYFELDLRFKREQWSKGRVPRELEFCVPFVYAPCIFIFARRL